MDKSRLNLRNVATVVACLAVTMFASCKKDPKILDLNGTVTISPTANALTGDELTASYNGSETVTLTWQWKKDGTTIANATSDKYTPTEAGSYTVTASAKGYNSKISAAVEVRLAIFLLENREREGFRYVYEYDDQERITKISIYLINNGQLNAVCTINYNADLIELISGSNKTTYTKNGNKIIFGNSEIDLNAQGLPEKYTSERYTSNLTWLNGNLTKEEGDGWSYTYTYDNYKSPFYNCKTPKWLLWVQSPFGNHYNVNNVKTETCYEGEDSGVITYGYTNNDDGFPVTRTVGGNTETYKYKKR